MTRAVSHRSGSASPDRRNASSTTWARRLIAARRKGRSGQVLPGPCFVSVMRIAADRASALEMRQDMSPAH